ncbi:molybdenum cofactor guanylyltransferase [Laceyella putida]|jgi:molybdopterin-guanine dinucleotide biosynthesis protein A|uniref:Probable molybdenum cofactor guanylyltransferase n=1 Tax=Laceyella putida TaxID=110101 RepID=A0ABW2RK21_9BACL
MEIAGVILAGGQNRRMHGQMKALLPIGEEMIIERQVREMKRICQQVILVTQQPEVFPAWVKREVQVIGDEIAGCGPLSGMDAAFAVAATPYVWVVACDMPYLSAVVAAALKQELERLRKEAAIPRLQGKDHPLHGVYRVDTGERIRELLLRKQYRVKELLQQLSCAYVEERFFAEQDLSTRCVININTREEYEAFVKQGAS